MLTLLPVLIYISFYALSLNGGKNGRLFFSIALLVHLSYIIYRFILLGWLPVTERHDILTVMSFLTATSFFYLNKRTDHDKLLDVLPLFVIFFAVYAVFQERINTIEPYMNSVWFYMYIIFFLSGYSLFTISTVTGIMYLLTKSSNLEIVQYRTALFGWLLFSLALVGGSVWFYLTYGSYWLWTAKELWITIVWFYYSFYLHTRMMSSLYGKPAVIIGVSGFPVIMFAYLGVMPLLGSPWSQF